MWVANNVRYTCTCGVIAGYSVNYRQEVTCNVCGKKMKKSHCRHTNIVQRMGHDKDDKTKGKCAKCGVYVNWVDEIDKSLYAN